MGQDTDRRGDDTNYSEYTCDLIRREQMRTAKLDALRKSIQEGLDSGTSDRTVSEIWADAEARFKDRTG